MAIPDFAQDLAEELVAVMADLADLEILISEGPEHMPVQEQQEIRKELGELKARIRRFLQ
jgi:hypothetical protein